jgi:hypothetical protein
MNLPLSTSERLNLGMYIMQTEPIWRRYCINCHYSVRLYVYTSCCWNRQLFCVHLLSSVSIPPARVHAACNQKQIVYVSHKDLNSYHC